MTADVIYLFRPTAARDLFAAPDDITSAARKAVAELAPEYGAVGTGIVVVDLVGRQNYPERAYLTNSIADGEHVPAAGWLHTAIGALLFVSVDLDDDGREYRGELYIVPSSRLRRCAAIWTEIADADLGASLRSPRWVVRRGTQGRYATALTVPLDLLASLATWQGEIAFAVAQ